jgi:hypothetical protein
MRINRLVNAIIPVMDSVVDKLSALETIWRITCSIDRENCELEEVDVFKYKIEETLVKAKEFDFFFLFFSRELMG